MAEPDRGLLFVFQIVHIWSFRGDKGIERELCAEAEAGDEAIEGGFAIDGCPRIDILEEPFLFLSGKLICEEVLAFVQRLHIALDLFVLLGASRLWVDIAVVKLFYEICHGSFSLFSLRNPCVHAVKI